MAVRKGCTLILFAAGDVGGARALLPVIQECDNRRLSFLVLKHGHIEHECLLSWPKVLPPNDSNPSSISTWLEELTVSALVFGSSVHDIMPLTLARQAKAMGVPVVHILDNWSNYRLRLEHDHLPMLVPDIYTLMDEAAYNGALAEGIPANVLRVIGHPALAHFADELVSCPKGHPSSEPIQLVFVSEPVEADQGTDPAQPGFRGYTEKVVLRLLCRALQTYADRIYLSILPHPREDRNALDTCWHEVRGVVPGTILTGHDGSRQVLAAEGVIGMASILLYEAWLAGLPVLSLQPGVRGDALRTLACRAGLSFVDSYEKIDAALLAWLDTLRPRARVIPPDLARHREAPARICTLIEDFVPERATTNQPMEREKR